MAVLTVLAVVLAGCQASGTPGTSGSGPVATTAVPTSGSVSGATASSASASASASASPRATKAPTSAQPLTGRTIVIDPGHNGVWTKRELRKVPSGNGRTKECNSSGTASNAGYSEHAYNWAQANALAAMLREQGATVRLTRPNDHGEGPCVNLRSKVANELKADALISIHADGNLARGARGFHVIYSTTMVGGAKVEAASRRLATQVRNALQAGTPMPRSSYIGGGTALHARTDLGTLNLSQRPAVLIEMGNMRNATDAALLASASFRARVATALTAAIEAYLG